MLVFNGEFIGWSLALAVTLFAIAYAFFFILIHWVWIILAAGAIMTYGFKWARIFLIRMIVDYDAANGNGLVIIERLLPHPTLPETVQFPLQQAAQGSPEVNTKGLFNTFVTQFKGLSFLRSLVIGDLTLKGPAAPFGITMYSIKNPAGVKARLEADWKKIDTLNTKLRTDKERNEQIDRTAVGVARGLVEGFAAIKNDLPKPETLPLPPPEPAPPEPMDWEPAWSLKSRVAGKGRGRPAKYVRRAPQPPSDSGLDGSEITSLPSGEGPVDPNLAPFGSTDLISFAPPGAPPHTEGTPAHPEGDSPPATPPADHSGDHGPAQH